MDNNSKVSRSTKKSKVSKSASKKNSIYSLNIIETFQRSRLTNADKDGNTS